jgi:endonuclease/exonuclease/phosphatase family metal-dependent hydrolase
LTKTTTKPAPPSTKPKQAPLKEAPLPAKPAPTPAKLPQTPLKENHLTVMTWNLHGGNPGSDQFYEDRKREEERKEKKKNNCDLIPSDPEMGMTPFKDVILNYNNNHPGHEIAILALQEVHREQVKILVTLLNNDPQNRRVIQYKYHFLKTNTCNCTDAEGKLDYGSALISSLPMENRNEATLHVRQPVNKTDCSSDRINCTYCDKREDVKILAYSVQLPGGRWVRVYSNHSSGINSYDLAADKRELEKLSFFVYTTDRTLTRLRDVILMGDFNLDDKPDPFADIGGTPAFHPKFAPYMYKMLTRDFGFRDSWEEMLLSKGITGPEDSGNTVPTRRRANRRFDHIFLGLGSSFMQVKNAEVLSTGTLSDHLPLVAELKF